MTRLRIAITGFGRIGRLALRSLLEQPQYQERCSCVAINATGDAEQSALLFAYDSVHGRFSGDVRSTDGALEVDGQRIALLQERDINRLDWRPYGVDTVLECTGQFKSRALASRHQQAGARSVVISAPGEGVDATVVYGVNHTVLTSEHTVISNASCTTNCLALVADVLHRNIGIVHGHLSTVHAMTGDQSLIDRGHKDPRRGRAAAQAMVPTTTGATKALGDVIPELVGKLDGVAIRVPTANVSLVDLTFVAARDTSVAEINALFTDAALPRVLGVTDRKLVSVDFNHTPESAIFDLTQTKVIDRRLCRVLAWYDNEWAYATRMLDIALYQHQVLSARPT